MSVAVLRLTWRKIVPAQRFSFLLDTCGTQRDLHKTPSTTSPTSPLVVRCPLKYLSAVAGCYSVCPAPQEADGVLATDAPLGYPQTIVVDDAGTLYIAEVDRVRKVDANGIITTIISNGAPEWGGAGGPP